MCQFQPTFLGGDVICWKIFDDGGRKTQIINKLLRKRKKSTLRSEQLSTKEYSKMLQQTIYLAPAMSIVSRCPVSFFPI